MYLLIISFFIDKNGSLGEYFNLYPIILNNDVNNFILHTLAYF